MSDQTLSPRNYNSIEDQREYSCKIDNEKWSKHSDLVSLLLLVLLGWAIGYSLFGNDVFGIHSQMLSLVVSCKFKLLF